MSQKPRKSRASTLRSRNGCLTCRIRHVKCDESKPDCFQCTSTGRTCDRYAKPNDTITRNETSCSMLMAPTRMVYSIPFKIPGSQRDRQALHYYCVQAASDFSGFLQSDFWMRSLLQTSHEQPTVRHALVALNSVKMAYERPGQSEDDEEAMIYESQLHYNKAVRLVRKYITASPEPSPVVVLQCCLLLFALDSIRGDHDTALMHLDNGLSIIQSPSSRRFLSERTTPSAHADAMSELDVMFCRMDLQASMFDDARVPRYEHFSTARNTIKRGFSNLSEAQSALDVLMNQAFSFWTSNLQYKSVPLADLSPALLERKHVLAIKFQAWESAFDTFHARQDADPIENGDNRGTGPTLLALLYKSGKLLFDSSFPENLIIFGGSPNAPIEDILDLAETLVSRAVSLRRTFSAETGIVAPLFVIAMKCEDPLLSARAVGLLAHCGRREGLYDSKMVFDMIQAMQCQQHDSLDEPGPFQQLVPPLGESALEKRAAAIVDLPGGLGVMAEALGVSTGTHFIAKG